MPYKIHIADRKYTEYSVIDAVSLKGGEDIPSINPVEMKLFNHDIFDYNSDKNEVTIVHSTTRSMPNMPGVLVLEGNKRYGKYKNKFLYKCIPDDKRLPVFMVPYQIKYGFNKAISNKYIVFTFKHWEQKHPWCNIKQTIGDVDILPNFYEYQLYCKSLYASIQDFSKAAMKKLKLKTEEEYIHQIKNTFNVEDRCHMDVITIDPLTSKDFDDAFSIQEINDDIFCLSIYISNVSFWMDILGLWGSFSQRIATIYLPDRKRPMLPTILSDALCSLQENRYRFAFTMDVSVRKTTGEIKDINYRNCCIKVRKNLRYDTDEMSNDELFKKAMIYVRKMNKNKKYVESIRDCHDLIAYLMVLMNYNCAQYLNSKKKGIFRSAKLNKTFVSPEHMPEEVQKFLKMWNSFGGQYLKYENIDSHDILDFDAYVHITSPIRRLVDLLNMVIIQDDMGLMEMSGDIKIFCERWTNDTAFEYINTTMRSIRKVQNDCNLLNICTNDVELLTKTYDGFIFDKIQRNDELFQYMVYLPHFRMVNRFTSRHNEENLSKQKFKLYIFMDENQLKQKIRVEMQPNHLSQNVAN